MVKTVVAIRVRLFRPPWMHISTTRLSLLDRGLFMLLLIFEVERIRPLMTDDGKCLKEEYIFTDCSSMSSCIIIHQLYLYAEEVQLEDC
jgi:hypothetical protein